MKKQDKDMDRVEALLRAARDQPQEVPEGLMARVLADAGALQPTQAVPVAGPGLVARFTEFVGGWQGMGGLVAATCAGVWIGLSPPSYVPDAGALILGYASADDMTTTAELTSFGWDLDGD